MSEVPNGWKLVPVEPTHEMLRSMEREWLTGSQVDMARREYKQALAAAPAAPQAGNWIAADDVQRLTRELDVLLNGEEGAAPQASLCDLVAQVRAAKQAAPQAEQQAESPQEPLTYEWVEAEYDHLLLLEEERISYGTFQQIVATIERALAIRWGVTLKGDT